VKFIGVEMKGFPFGHHNIWVLLFL